MKTYLGRGGLAVLACTALVIAGPEWREDQDGGEDAGSTPFDAQATTGTGGLAGVSGQLQALAGLTALGPGGPIADFDDVFIVCIDDPANFRATTADSGGFSEFDSRLYLFSLDGFGIVGNNTPPVVLDSGGGPSTDGAVLENASTDGTGSQVLTSGLYLLAITVAPRTPLGPNGEPIFFFGQPDEISGPDGPDGGEPLADWNDGFGACCLPDGGCVLATEAACLFDEGGTYQGDGSVCADVTCPVLEGACCDEGDCFVTSAGDCAKSGGEYQGDGTSCDEATCPQPTNDLCVDAFEIELGDTLFDTTQAATDGTPDCKGLQAANDIWYTYTASDSGLLEVSTCDQADFDTVLFGYDSCVCPLDAGSLVACGDDTDDCSGNTTIISLFVEAGQCSTIRVGGFLGEGGSSSGTGTLTLSLTPVGACIFGKYGCEILTEDQCSSMEGFYLGDGTPCPSAVTGTDNAPAPAPGPIMAVTPGGGVSGGIPQLPATLPEPAGGDTPEPDGEYTIMLQGVCFASEVPTGGCVFPDGSCDVTTEFECVEDAGGTWLGEDVPCPDVTPPAVTCTATPGRGNAIVVGWTAEDESGPVDVTAVIDAGCAIVPVPNGQLVRLPWCAGNGNGNGNSATAPTGLSALRLQTTAGPAETAPVSGGNGPPCVVQAGPALLFHSTDVTLIVTAVDAAGNQSTCTIDLCASVGGN